MEYRALLAWLSFADTNCGNIIDPALATVARRVHGTDRYDTPTGGQRTAGRWAAILVAKGWLHRIHRVIRHPDGRIEATSCCYRLDLPDHRRAARHQREDATRARNNRRDRAPDPTPRPGNPPVPPASRLHDQAEHRRQELLAEQQPPDPGNNRAGLAGARRSLREGLARRHSEQAQPP